MPFYKEDPSSVSNGIMTRRMPLGRGLSVKRINKNVLLAHMSAACATQQETVARIVL